VILANVPILTKHALKRTARKKDGVRWNQWRFFPEMEKLRGNPWFLHPAFPPGLFSINPTPMLTEATGVKETTGDFNFQVQQGLRRERIVNLHASDGCIMEAPELLYRSGCLKGNRNVLTVQKLSGSILLKNVMVF